MVVTEYTRFFFDGHFATTNGLRRPMIFEIAYLNALGAVAVRAITFTLGGKMLLSSPILRRLDRKVSPLLKHNYVVMPTTQFRMTLIVAYLPFNNAVGFIDNESLQSLGIGVGGQHPPPTLIFNEELWCDIDQLVISSIDARL